MSEYYFYKTKPGDTWEKLATKFFGNCFKFAPIIMANPDVPISPFIPEGITVKIPAAETSVKDTKLPPWKI